MPANWSSTPKTWSTGELVTASTLNAELRDRMEYLKVLLSGHYISIEDQKSSGTNGGTFTSGAWQTRDLNTEVSDTGGHASIASNQITLAAGVYIVNALVPAANVVRHQARLYNVTGGAVLLLGTSERCGSSGSTPADFVQTPSRIKGLIDLTASAVLEVQHYCVTTGTSTGFGYAAGITTEVYTTIELIRIDE
ncbi:MAG: hypothetical protein K8I60_01855 [Anaerolineae bacterium]|nr:hypothetical protein [Anaerolineae bacterium]